MAASMSMKDYLKRYQSRSEEEEKKIKKKKKMKKPEASSVLVVDGDPVWQKPVNIEEEEGTESPDETPVVDEDIEVKRMRRLEQIKQIRAYDAIAEDGSGWVSVSSTYASSVSRNSDISPPRKKRTRKDTPSPEPRMNVTSAGREKEDLSPPRKSRPRNDTPSPKPKTNKPEREDVDLSPPRKHIARKDSRSPEYRVGTSMKEADLSPPRRRAVKDMSAPAKSQGGEDADLSPPRKRKVCDDTLSPQHRLEPSRDNAGMFPPKNHRARYVSLSPKERKNADLSPPHQRHRRHHTPSPDHDLSPPRRSLGSRPHSDDIMQKSSASRVSPDLSPPRMDQKELAVQPSMKERRKTGLISGTEIREQNSKIRTSDSLRLKDMDPSMTGQGAEPVFRIAGQPVSKEEYLKSRQKVEEKPKAIVLISKEEGIKGYWKGNLPQVIRIIPYSAVQLFAYETYKKIFKGKDGELFVIGRLAAGACAGMTSTFVTYPLYVLRLRLAVEPGYRTMSEVALNMLREEGVASFYYGLGPSLIGIAPYIAVNFCMFDLIKKALPEKYQQKAQTSLLTAVLSAGIATLC